jgi:hypothetical protein
VGRGEAVKILHSDHMISPQSHLNCNLPTTFYTVEYGGPNLAGNLNSGDLQ